MTDFEDTLSTMLKTGLKPLFFRYVMFSLNVSIVEVSIRSFNGVSNIAFDDQFYSTKISVLPSLDLIGNFLCSQHISSHFLDSGLHPRRRYDCLFIMLLTGADLYWSQVCLLLSLFYL